MNKPRKLSVYERNQLLKYSLKENDLLSKGSLPVEYLTGIVNFAGIELRVDQNVLIPRVETEELVELIVGFIKKNNKPVKYLEVGTGSGAISLAVLAAVKNLRNLPIKKFVMTDISEEALLLAKQNLQAHFISTVASQVSFIHSDLLKKVMPQTFEVIVANLPYIPSGEMLKLDSSVKDFEPHIALEGGETGFEMIAVFLQQIIEGAYLSSEGQIFLEVHKSHTLEFITKFYRQFLDHFKIQEVKDQFSRQRFLLLTLL